MAGLAAARTSSGCGRLRSRLRLCLVVAIAISSAGFKKRVCGRRRCLSYETVVCDSSTKWSTCVFSSRHQVLQCHASMINQTGTQGSQTCTHRLPTRRRSRTSRACSRPVDNPSVHLLGAARRLRFGTMNLCRSQPLCYTPRPTARGATCDLWDRRTYCTPQCCSLRSLSLCVYVVVDGTDADNDVAGAEGAQGRRAAHVEPVRAPPCVLQPLELQAEA